MLLFVLVAIPIDDLMISDNVRDIVFVEFSTNEILSIMENLGLADVSMPQIITKELEKLHKMPENIR